MSINISDRNILFWEWYSQEGLSYDAIAKKAYEEGYTEKILTREAVRQAVNQNPQHKARSKSEARLVSSRRKEELEQRVRLNVIFLYENGLSIEDISNNTERDIDLIEMFISDHIKNSKKQTDKSNIIERDNEIIKKYFDEADPKSTSELAEEYGLTETRILQIIRRNNRKLRTHKEAKKLQSIKSGNIVTEEVALDAMKEKAENNVPYSRYCRERGIKYTALMRGIKEVLNPT